MDMRDLMLEATAEVQEIVREVMEELTLPMMEQALRMKWAQMPAELKEELKQTQPLVFQRILDMVKGE